MATGLASPARGTELAPPAGPRALHPRASLPADPLAAPPAPTIQAGCSPCPSPCWGVRTEGLIPPPEPWGVPGRGSPSPPPLSCQGIAPWSPRAAEALSVINGLLTPPLQGEQGWGSALAPPGPWLGLAERGQLVRPSLGTAGQWHRCPATPVPSASLVSPAACASPSCRQGQPSEASLDTASPVGPSVPKGWGARAAPARTGPAPAASSGRFGFPRQQPGCRPEGMNQEL